MYKLADSSDTPLTAHLADISEWMSRHHLKLNLDKTELVFLQGKDLITALLCLWTFSRSINQRTMWSLIWVRLFSVLALQWWNELRTEVRTTESLPIFCCRLKPTFSDYLLAFTYVSFLYKKQTCLVTSTVVLNMLLIICLKGTHIECTYSKSLWTKASAQWI